MRLLSRQIGFAVLGFTLLSPLAHSGDVVVHVPCGSPGLRTCDPVINGGGTISGSQAGATQVRGMLDLLSGPNGRIPQYAACLYGGHDPSPLSTGDACAGTTFGPLVCDPVASPFNGNKPEGLDPTGKNNIGGSCGNPATLKATGNYQMSLGLLTGVNYYNTNVNLAVATSKELGFFNGALVQAEACYMSQVTTEISTQQQLTLSDQSPCAPAATDLIAQNTSYSNAVGALQNALGTQQNIADILNCENTSQSATGDRGSLRQSAQYLCSARLALESAFTQLAACEVFQRAQSSWTNHLGSQASVQAFMDSLNKGPSSLTAACSKYCDGKLGGNYGPTASTSQIDKDVSACAQNCYNSGAPGIDSMPIRVQAYVGKNWPSKGGGCQP